MTVRQIVLDTETTGLEPEQGHRIIEIGCVELLERRLTGNNFHQYLQPDREIDAAAIEVHGITNEFLADKPRFKEVATDFIEYARGAELIIHNAPFDVGFLDHELAMVSKDPVRIAELCKVTDTLVMAKRMHPGQRNSLDALCKRYAIDNSHRELHGALLDAEILSDVYLRMTGGQALLSLDDRSSEVGARSAGAIRRLPQGRWKLLVASANQQELEAHEAQLDSMGQKCVWRC